MRLDSVKRWVWLYPLAAIGLIGLAGLGFRGVRMWRGRGFRPPFMARIPNSILPGAPRDEGPPRFRLDDDNAVRMPGMDAPAHERWTDIAGNHYTGEFIARFRYDGTRPAAPVVRVRWDRRAPTFRGRIEARGLKPNFAYQVKLVGDFGRDPAGAEAIGYQGRWRLPGPGRATNFTDRDFRRFTPRHQADAYLVFDFFVTDRQGNAALDFALESSLHVLWNRDRQRRPDRPDDVVSVRVEADDPDLYARPKADPTIEHLWAERAHRRYRSPSSRIRLPPGTYQAFLALTEESFHAVDRDGGFWATVFRLPVAFQIVAPTP